MISKQMQQQTGLRTLVAQPSAGRRIFVVKFPSIDIDFSNLTCLLEGGRISDGCRCGRVYICKAENTYDDDQAALQIH